MVHNFKSIIFASSFSNLNSKLSLNCCPQKSFSQSVQVNSHFNQLKMAAMAKLQIDPRLVYINGDQMAAFEGQRVRLFGVIGGVQGDNTFQYES